MYLHMLMRVFSNPFRYYVFSIRWWASAVPLLFIFCTSAVHLLPPCCFSHVLLFCLSSTSCTFLALLKFLYSSSAFHLTTLRRSQDALKTLLSPERFLSSKLHRKAEFQTHHITWNSSLISSRTRTPDCISGGSTLVWDLRLCHAPQAEHGLTLKQYLKI